MPDNARPNILWYCTDQQRFDTIGALGNPHVHTPNLDRLVERGVAFTHAYCQSPICTPSRASFLTGMYPSALHVHSNGSLYFPSEHTMVTRMLADSGYDCGLVGKLGLANGDGADEPRVESGYRYYEYSNGPKVGLSNGNDYLRWIREKGLDPVSILGPPSDIGRYDRAAFAGFTSSLHRGGLKLPTPDKDNAPVALHQTTWCTEKAVEFISERRPSDQPWLLSVNPFDPHPPFDPPWEYFRRFDPETLPGPHFRESDLGQQERLRGIDFQTQARNPKEFDARSVQAAYYAMIELIDDRLGAILDALDETGQRERTVVVFTTDHGEALGDHGLLLKGCRFYEGLVRVPLIWSWPGHFSTGLRSDALVELLDIAPTLLELAGLSIPERMQGRSLLSILRGTANPDDHRDFVRSEYYDALPLPDGTMATMYRDRRWKLVVYHSHGFGELFDLQVDPHEFENLWDDPACQTARADLLLKSYDASVMALDWGPPLVPKYEDRPAFRRPLGKWGVG